MQMSNINLIPTQLVAHLHFCQPHKAKQKIQKSYQTNAPDQTMDERRAADNSTYKKLAVQWSNEALYFVLSFVVVGSEVLRNRQLLVSAKRYAEN